MNPLRLEAGTEACRPGSKVWEDRRQDTGRMTSKKGALKVPKSNTAASRAGAKAVSGSASSGGNGKTFQLLNSIITQDDIVPLSRTEKTRGEEDTWEGDGDEDVVSTADTDPDLLFSPLNSGHEDEDEDEYDNDYLSPVYFGAQYPRRFHPYSHTKSPPLEHGKNNACNDPLSGLLGINEDFWKEVAMTKEESICYPQETPLESLALSSNSSSNDNDMADTSFDEFITEDLGCSTTMDSATPNWNEDFKIKLLCYRDSKGNFRLKTEEDPRPSKSSVSKGCVTKKWLKKHNKNKNKRLLKHAIRRKSGVWEMVNTGIGIGEFML